MKALRVLGIVGMFFTASSALAGGVDVQINEIRIDQPGSDVDEYFELTGAPGTSLDGLSYIVIGDGSSDGSGDLAKRSGVVEAIVDLTGLEIPADGFFFAVEEDNWSGDLASIGSVDLLVQSNTINFENGDNVSHLLVAGLHPSVNVGGGFGGTDLDVDNDGFIDDLIDTDGDGNPDSPPWSEIIDAISLIEKPNGEGHTPPGGNADEWDYGFGGGIGPDCTFVPGHVFRCHPFGNWTIGGFNEETGQDTAGTINVACPPALDIKPGSCPNPFNRNSNGVLPVALLGDVTQVDLSSVQLSRADGVGGSVAPLAGPPGPHSVFEDVASPFDGEPCDCHDLGGDGFDDLSMKFRTSDVVEALELDDLGPGAFVELVLSGILADESEFSASDCIVIVPPDAGQSSMAVESNVFDTFMELTPLDLNVDSDGFTGFARAYVKGTTVTVTAPLASNGRKFLRWSVDGLMQPFGLRTIEITIGQDTSLQAFFKRQNRLVPDHPTEDEGGLE